MVFLWEHKLDAVNSSGKIGAVVWFLFPKYFILQVLHFDFSEIYPEHLLKGIRYESHSAIISS